MDAWVTDAAAQIASTAEHELERLVAVSSPSGDVPGAQAALAVAQTLLPADAHVQRVPCSTAQHADDLIATVRGSGRARILLVGHVDTVVAHAVHEPLRAEADRLVGSGSIDMKGGDVLALGVLRALAARREDIGEVALLLVTDEEWRVGEFAHGPRFAGYDACLCFEGGELDGDGEDAVIVRRKAAGTVRVTARGRSAHSGANPDAGRNALLALAAAAQAVAGCHDPGGPDELTAVPTVLHCGGAFNVVPSQGELLCDVRAQSLDALDRVLAAIPHEVGGAALQAQNVRRWPGMDHRASMAPVLEEAAGLLGRSIVGAPRGGASDASHFATIVPLCVDGLGPLGGQAHAPGEYVLAASLHSRAQVALAIAGAIMARA